MNSPLLRWLLDLDTIPQGAVGLRLAWEHALPAWAWAAIVITAGFLAFWSYSRLVGGRRGRAILGATRFLLVMLVLVILSGPMLELPRETVERDWVLMLLDRSASMRIADVQDASGRRLSRDEQLRALLAGQDEMWRRLAESRHVVWMGFHDGVFDLPLPAAGAGAGMPAILDEPDGTRTRLDAAIQQSLQRSAARALSGVVVFSDGRTTDPPSRAVVRRLRGDRIGVYAVPLGSPEALPDLAIRRVDAPRRAFVRDKVPVVVELDRLAGAAEGRTATVRLVDATDGSELDRAEVPAGEAATASVTLTAEPALAGEATWRVEVETDPADLIPDNNGRSFLIDLIDRPLRVLFVEGYPRWEYRYLKNVIIREKQIESSIMLISADRDFAQEGNQPITRLPRSPEEFAPYDVIILGDVPATFFSPEQLEMIRGHVADRGAGLLWVGGERFAPRTYAGTVLADLLPLRGSLTIPPIGKPVTMVPTELASQMGLLRLGGDGMAEWPVDLADASAGWSQLQYAQRIEPGRLKPTAEVLAETASEFHGARLPLVIQMRYGAGLVIYVATDEIWRWRYGRGELLPERFWVQILRRLGRESLAGSGEPARLEVTPRRLTSTQSILVELELLDARFYDESRSGIPAVVETADGHAVAELDLRLTEAPSTPGQGAPARYTAVWRPGVTGQLRVRLDDPALAGERLAVPVEVVAPDDELRHPETDHPLLEAIASQSDGEVIAPSELGDLAALLPNRSVRTSNPLTERIWDTPLAFGLVLLLLAAEWIGRKIIRLA